MNFPFLLFSLLNLLILNIWNLTTINVTTLCSMHLPMMFAGYLLMTKRLINGFRSLLVTVSLFEIIENSRSFCLSNTAVLSIYCFIPTLTIAWGYKVIVKKTCLSS